MSFEENWREYLSIFKLAVFCVQKQIDEDYAVGLAWGSWALIQEAGLLLIDLGNMEMVWSYFGPGTKRLFPKYSGNMAAIGGARIPGGGATSRAWPRHVQE